MRGYNTAARANRIAKAELCEDNSEEDLVRDEEVEWEVITLG